MNLLAIDTSSNACSVALQVGEAISEKHVVEPREHTKILVPMIEELMREGDTSLSDQDAIVLGNGPGSFIGMRIGASVAQGICFAAGLQIVPVSSLAAIAAEVMNASNAEKVLVAQDARMQEIYLGQYHRDENDLPVALADEEICRIGTIAGLDDKFVAAGEAWGKFPQLKESNRSWVAEFADVCVPRARYLLGFGGDALSKGQAIDPATLNPAYIRVKVAEKTRPEV